MLKNFSKFIDEKNQPIIFHPFKRITMDFDNPIFIFLAPTVVCIILCSIVLLAFGMSSNSYLKFKKFPYQEINPEKPIIEDFEELAFN
jgi:hypothetical protein